MYVPRGVRKKEWGGGGNSELGVPGSGQDPASPGGCCKALPRGAGDLFGCANTETFPVLSLRAMAAVCVGGGGEPVRVIPGDKQPPDMFSADNIEPLFLWRAQALGMFN